MSILDAEVTTLAFCWIIDRRDGVRLAFTSHDRDVEVDGILCRAAPGMLPSAIGLSEGFADGGITIDGALSARSITEEDLSAGRWDGAAVRLLLADWEDPAAPAVPLACGTLGAVTLRGGAFQAELNGPAAELQRPVVEQTSPECRAELGDRRCRIDMAGRTTLTRVTASAEDFAVAVASALPPHLYVNGRARWITGRNCGIETRIASVEGEWVTLRDPPFHRPETGDLVELREGCDKSIETCSGRFANAANFRGEPHLPGMDLLTRYPGS